MIIVYIVIQVYFNSYTSSAREMIFPCFLYRTLQYRSNDTYLGVHFLHVGTQSPAPWYGTGMGWTPSLCIDTPNAVGWPDRYETTIAATGITQGPSIKILCY